MRNGWGCDVSRMGELLHSESKVKGVSAKRKDLGTQEGQERKDQRRTSLQSGGSAKPWHSPSAKDAS